MKRWLVLIMVMVVAVSAAGCGAKAPDATADEAMATTKTTATADESQPTTAKKTKTKAKKNQTKQASHINPGDIFNKCTLIFERSGTNWGSYLKINPDGTFSVTYHKPEKSKTGAADKTVKASSFTGNFTELTKMSDYYYSMRVANVRFKEKPGTQKKNGSETYLYTDETVGFAEGKTVYLYAPNMPVDKLPHNFLYYAKMPKGIPNGKVLGGYCIKAADGKPYYSTNK